MEKITYGAPRLVDWVAQIKAGAATVRVHFTGGALTSYGVTPAEYTTANPFIQKVIEQSTYFKEGRIILLRRTALPDVAKPKAPAPKPQTVAPTPEAPAPAPAEVEAKVEEAEALHRLLSPKQNNPPRKQQRQPKKSQTMRRQTASQSLKQTASKTHRHTCKSNSTFLPTKSAPTMPRRKPHQSMVLSSLAQSSTPLTAAKAPRAKA